MIDLTILLDAFRMFDIKLFDVDFFELLLRLFVDVVVAYVIIHYIYQPTRKDSQYVFTFLIFNPLVFFVCHLFSKVDLSIGFAFGLFAVFSILRYRTTQIQVKEMTYMFIVISVAVINALATKKVSYVELMFTNLFIIAATYFIEKYTMSSSINVVTIRYNTLENIKPENADLLIQDLESKIGKTVIKHEIIEIDVEKNVVKLRVFYE